MAGVGLLALLDDIATLLDDVAVLTKVAAKKTAGVLGDDLALNAEQVSGVKAERELPVVWAVAKGSALNKLILVPVALAMSAFAPWLITPFLMLGGTYLCYEGFEKIAHKLLHSAADDTEAHRQILAAAQDPVVDIVAFERKKVKGAIRTDLVLSAEVVVIALGTVQHQPFQQQVVVVSLIAAVITVGVYGTVAGIVKLDDAGLYLMQSQTANMWGQFKRWFGRGLLAACPYLMKTLTVAGTAAMFLVGGGIILHGFPAAHGVIEQILTWTEQTAIIASIPAFVTTALISAVTGIAIGAVAVVAISLVSGWVGKRKQSRGQ
ncbi:MAG: DUF808 domain-containing protein [Spongiibacteraceae bacterium]